MDAFSIPDLISGQAAAKGRYLEFLRRDSLSMGVYTLPQGGVDPQKPHAEDEVYYVLGGTASISVGDEQRAVAPGDLIYVDKEVEHRFHTITADLSLLVFFAPAEGTMPSAPQRGTHEASRPQAEGSLPSAERSQPPATS
jgi:mannose-6-phosphate isomerase-like protein (cupin superfamily)